MVAVFCQKKVYGEKSLLPWNVNQETCYPVTGFIWNEWKVIFLICTCMNVCMAPFRVSKKYNYGIHCVYFTIFIPYIFQLMYHSSWSNLKSWVFKSDAWILYIIKMFWLHVLLFLFCLFLTEFWNCMSNLISFINIHRHVKWPYLVTKTRKFMDNGPTLKNDVMNIWWGLKKKKLCV